MPGARKAGMDHDVYLYSSIERRPPFRLPGGARVAVFILLHLEYRELTPPAGAYRDPRFRGEFGDFQPEYRTWTYREYGDRIGVFRLLSLFDAFDLPVSVAINAAAAERRPNLVKEARSRGYELVAHGLSATQMITSRMSEDEERRHISESRDRLQRALGVTPRGWLGQDYGVTARTSRLLAEAGFVYTLDWPNDEQPYWHNPDRSLVAVPSQPDWDDVQTLLSAARAGSFVSATRSRCDRTPRGGERRGARVRARRSSVDVWGAPSRPLPAGGAGSRRRFFRRSARDDRPDRPMVQGRRRRMKLSAAANVLRSKNAGPLALTIDILFPSRDLFDRAAVSPGLARAAVAKLYGLSDNEVAVTHVPKALAIKVTMPRPIVAGSPGDLDVYGAQQHLPLLDVEL